MKKLFVMILAVVLVLSLVVTGCGPKDDESEVSPTPTLTETATVQPTAEQTTGDMTAAQPASGENGILGTGPNGETATLATTLSLTDEEIAQVKEGGYTAAIVFHYDGNDWSSAQQKGLEDTFAMLGIGVVAVTDAHFDAQQQVADIEMVSELNPDIMVSIPIDPAVTAPAYTQAAQQGVKIVFMDNCPKDMEVGVDYVSVVSADNYGNGVNAAKIMADNLGGSGKIGVIYYDADFFVTNQRVDAFVNTIETNYPNIEIVAQSGFADPNNVSEVADAMLGNNPDIGGIFVVWDIPAEAVAKSAIAAGRDDLVITTIDLGTNVAKMIADNGLIKGVGAQLPYDQGVAEATLAAYALLGKEAPAYVAVPAMAVTSDNVRDAYKMVYHSEAPDDIQNTAK